MSQAPPERTGPFPTRQDAEAVRRQMEVEYADFLDQHDEVAMELEPNGPGEIWVVALRGSPGWGLLEVDDD